MHPEREAAAAPPLRQVHGAPGREAVRPQQPPALEPPPPKREPSCTARHTKLALDGGKERTDVVSGEAQPVDGERASVAHEELRVHAHIFITTWMGGGAGCGGGGRVQKGVADGEWLVGAIGRWRWIEGVL